MMIFSALGDLAGAERHFIAGQPYYELPEYRFQLLSGGIVAVFGHAAKNAWMSGWTELARQRLAKIAAAAAESNNQWFQALAHHLTARVLNYMRDYNQAEHAAALGLELSERIALPEFAAYLRFDLGWARASTGRSAEVSLMLQAVEEMRKLGSLGYEPKAQLAQGLECAGATAEALETVEQALRMSSERCFRPEALRTRGELRLKLGEPNLAETDFRDAIALARRMDAKAWELRATMSLSRLLASRGRGNEARTTLADIYNWFTEGFDTADLKDAKVLLDELSV